MSSYVILNFEDKIGGTGKGAADGTLQALEYRYTNIKQVTGFKGMFVGKNTVNEHRCVIDTPAIGFVSDAKTVQGIKQACAGAKKVYLVLHGDPRTSDTAYTNAIGKIGVVALCNSQQLATFLASVLPIKAKQTLALVMCYGARCKDYKSANVNHQGAMGIGDLKTSFAYRLVYELTQLGYQPLLSAVTGKIQHDNTSGRALIEREELIDVNMELAVVQRQYTQDAKLGGGGEAWKKTDTGKAQFDAIKTLQDDRSNIRSQLKSGDESNKYGKLVFRYAPTTLTIANKYGGPGGGDVGPGTVLYSGPLVPPGAV